MFLQLWRLKALANVPIRPHGFGAAQPEPPSDTSAQLWHGKAIASPTRSLDLVCAKAWQTLATVSPSVHLARSTKTQLSLSHHAHSTLRDQAANTDFDHGVPAMQHPVHVRLAVTDYPSIATSGPRTTRCTG